MSNRRISPRLSIKASSSSCSASSPLKNETSLIDCSPTSSSSTELSLITKQPLLSSPKTSKSNSKLSKIQQQIKTVAKKPPRVISTMLNTEINQLKLTKTKGVRKSSKLSQKKFAASTNSPITISNRKNKKTKKNLNIRKKSSRLLKKTENLNSSSNRIASDQITTSVLPVTTASTPISTSLIFSLSNQSTPTSSSNHYNLSSALNALITVSTPTTTNNNVNSSLGNLESIILNQSLRYDNPININTNNNNNNNNSLSNLQSSLNLFSDISDLKFQLKKATIKFEKACRQLMMLDQHINDLQNSYSNSLENDRKTFKIVYRMQLATLEGTHNAYIEYIERQVEKIKKLKRHLFNENANQHINNSFNNINTIGSTSATVSSSSTVNNIGNNSSLSTT